MITMIIIHIGKENDKQYWMLLALHAPMLFP